MTQFYKITKNGKDLKNGLSKKEANELFFPLIEDHSSGYVYDNETETIYNEVDKRVIASEGDESVNAGDNYFEIAEEIVTYKIQDREAGNVIEVGLTEKEAYALLSEFEEQDKKEGTFTLDFYEIVPE